MKSLPYLDTTLPIKDRITDLLKRMTIEEKIGILPTEQSGVPRLNIQDYGVGGEGAHGVVDRTQNPTTVFPQPHGLACTWNKKLLKRVGSAIGDEARAKYNKSGMKHWLSLWFPTIDMERDPRWGRNEEAYGEDPTLAGKLSVELIKGAQGEHDFYVKLCTAPKHFYANNYEKDRTFISSVVDKRNKHEYYLKVFEYAYRDGKALSMMTAYNEINGTPAILNKEVQNIVKDEWGCDGYVVCDGNDFEQNVTHHFYNKTHAETLAMALKAGIDCFVDSRELVMGAARDALEKNLINENDIDKALYNIFKVRFRLGQFDGIDNDPYANIGEDVICCDEFSQLAKEACTESIVLLKNDGLLPLDSSKVKSIAVIGEVAKGFYPDWYAGTPKHYTDLLDSLKKSYGAINISYHTSSDIISFKLPETEKYLRIDNSGKVYVDGTKETKAKLREIDWGFGVKCYVDIVSNKYLTMKDGVLETSSEVFEVSWYIKEQFFTEEKEDYCMSFKGYGNSFEPSNLRVDKDLSIVLDEIVHNSLILKREVLENGIEKSIEIAKNSDIVITNIGNNPLINAKECVDRDTIKLDSRQSKICKEISDVNPNSILLLTSGYQFSISDEIENYNGVLYMTQGGQETGSSVTDVLFGQASPSGKLPVTWYQDDSDLYDINDYDIINNPRTYQYFKGKLQYPFGFGLSYTNFEYSNLKLSSNVMKEDIITVSLNVTNVGKYSAFEVVQMYFAISESKIVRPIKQLCDFDKIFLGVGETKEVTLSLKRHQMQIYDVNSDSKIVEKGNYTIMVGSSSNSIHLESNLTVIGEEINARNVSFIIAENFDKWNGATLIENSDKDVCVSIREQGELFYKECNFNKETKFHINIGKGSQGNIKIISNGASHGEIIIKDITEKSEYFSCNINAISDVHDITLLGTGNLLIKDFYFD